MNRRLQVMKYLFADYLMAMAAWVLFFTYRKLKLEPTILYEDIEQITSDANLWKGMVLIPFFWIILYYATGFYRKIYRRSRLKELWETMAVSFVGVLAIFFFLILDDIILSYRSYYYFFSVLFLSHFSLTYI